MTKFFSPVSLYGRLCGATPRTTSPGRTRWRKTWKARKTRKTRRTVGVEARERVRMGVVTWHRVRMVRGRVRMRVRGPRVGPKNS